MQSFSYDVAVLGNRLSSALLAVACQKKGLHVLWAQIEESSLGDFAANSPQASSVFELLPSTPKASHWIRWAEELMEENFYTGPQSLDHFALERSSGELKPFRMKASVPLLYSFFFTPEYLTTKTHSLDWIEKLKKLFCGDTKQKTQITSLKHEKSSFHIVFNEQDSVTAQHFFTTQPLDHLKKWFPHIKPKASDDVHSTLYFLWKHKIPLNENPAHMFYLVNSLKSESPEVLALGRFLDPQSSHWMSLVQDLSPDFLASHLQKVKKAILKIKPSWKESLLTETIGFKALNYGTQSLCKLPEKMKVLSPVYCESEGLLAELQLAFESYQILENRCEKSSLEI